MLIGRGVFHDSADVDSSFMGKGALPDEGEILVMMHIGDFTDIVRKNRQPFEFVFADGM